MTAEARPAGSVEEMIPAGWSLRFRLNLMIVLAMLLIIGLGALFAIHNARRSVAEEIDSTVNLALQLIEVGLAESRGTSEWPPNWLNQLGQLDKTRHLSIQVRPASNPTGDDPSEKWQEEHPPIDRSIGADGEHSPAPQWFVWSVAPQPLVMEKRIVYGDREEFTLLIEANPADEIAEAWNEARGFLVLMAALAVAVYLLVHVMVGRAFRTVSLILEGLEDIQQGDYGKRLPHLVLPEFSRISQAFNHMASALERARDENRALTQQTLTIQEEERRFLAQEVHDEWGQSLSAIKVMAASLRQRSTENADHPAVDHIMSICDRLFGVVRAMMRRLRPLILDELGLAASVEDLLGYWQNRNPGIKLEFHCQEGVEPRVGTAKIHLYRIIQESLTNVIKHAEASRVRIELQWAETESLEESWVLLRVSDDGQGFEPHQPRRGFGLLGIRERVASLGGQFALMTRPGEGVLLEIRVPSNSPHERLERSDMTVWCSGNDDFLRTSWSQNHPLDAAPSRNHA
jgi:two-component system sensor histidine kinase UhpB